MYGAFTNVAFIAMVFLFKEGRLGEYAKLCWSMAQIKKWTLGYDPRLTEEQLEPFLRNCYSHFSI